MTMFSELHQQPEDKILALMGLFKADTRDHKIDLGVGVYKDANGHTPIMSAIKKAEQKLIELEDSKSYTGLAGEASYHQAMSDLLLADSTDRSRLAFSHTPGGTGAVNHCFQLAKAARPNLTVWVSDPTWPNHVSILKHLGIQTKTYRYFDSATRGVNFDGMMEDLSQISEGDLVLLHGCCHNPTGANINITQWQSVAELLLSKNAIPFVDIAYQGFGDGLDADAKGVRLLASLMPEMMIAASCSKNFGVYKERAGLVIVQTPDAAQAKVVQGNLAHLNRQSYSFPPDHGARLVTMVLTDAELRQDWEAELEAMRLGMLDVRQKLADALRDASGSDRFGFIAQHRGMFSRLGATEDQVMAMRNDHAIYMVGDSRVNIAGLTEDKIPAMVKAMLAVGI